MVDLRAAQELESRPMTAPVAPGPRERLLTSAERLTGRQGVGVGVDAILEDAAVARRSLYQHFGGKDELIATSLRESRRDEERYRAALDSGGDDPRQRILAVIDQLDTTTSNPDFPGCRFVSAELSLRNPNHPAHAVTRAYTERLHDLFEKELATSAILIPKQELISCLSSWMACWSLLHSDAAPIQPGRFARWWSASSMKVKLRTRSEPTDTQDRRGRPRSRPP